MLSNTESQEAVQAANNILAIILFAANGNPRKREQVQLVMSILNSATDSCTVINNFVDACNITFGKK